MDATHRTRPLPGQRETARPGARRALPELPAATLAVLALLAIGGCGRQRTVAEVPLEPVERRNITVTIEATGTVEPVDLVEVKSKASGQIVKMPVDVGSQVRAGALLVQVDTVDVRNQYDQAYAALRAAQAKADVSRAQRKRSEELYKQGVITANENESAAVDDASAQSALVAARTNLDIARQRLADATVRAPLSGTVLEQDVAVGQVIASATSSVSGGTTLLKMADLSRIRLRTLVSETDVGHVRAGQEATVTVDAFPNHPFPGTVEKIEPQAVVQQSVTMFPVLISIANEGGLLLPGMNGEVTLVVDQRENVLAVPVDAVRSVREVALLASTIGMRPDSARAQVERQMAALQAGRGQIAAAATDTPSGGSAWAAERSPGGSAAGRSAGAWGGRRDSSGGRRWPGAARRDSARASGGRGGRGWSGAGGSAMRRGGTSGGMNAGGMGGGGMGSGGTGSGVMGPGGGGSSRPQAVFVKINGAYQVRLVRLGISDFDYSEVVSGLNEGDAVAMLGVAEAQTERQQAQSNIRERMGSRMGVPGSGGGSRTSGGSSGGRTGGGGGGR